MLTMEPTPVQRISTDSFFRQSRTCIYDFWRQSRNVLCRVQFSCLLIPRLHFTFHIICCIYSSNLSEISYAYLYDNPASLSGGRGTKPQVADQLFQQILLNVIGRQLQLISSKCFPIHYSKITT